MHIIILLKIFHSRIINKYFINKNYLYIISIKSRKYIIIIFIYIQKNRDNRIIYSILIININYKNQNQNHKNIARNQYNKIQIYSNNIMIIIYINNSSIKNKIDIMIYNLLINKINH